MNSAEINWIAVVVAGVGGYAFGAVWYMTLSRPWLAAVERSKEELRARVGKSAFVVAALAQFVIAYALARVVAWHGAVTVSDAVVAALLIWLGFVLAPMLVNHGFQGARRSLTLIDATHWLGVLLIQAVIVGRFGA